MYEAFDPMRSALVCWTINLMDLLERLTLLALAHPVISFEVICAAAIGLAVRTAAPI
jgi:hypothetical protein